MKYTDEKNIHEGHRGRLLELVDNAGLSNVSKVQALEFILTYVFPRGDTNPLAHRLLDRYGNVAGVFNADPQDMMMVRGIGKRAAALITKFPEIFDYYMQSTYEERPCLNDTIDLLDFVEDLVRIKITEELYIVALDIGFRLISARLLAKGSISMVGISQREITKFINATNPAFVFLVHNHPGGRAKPSQQDLEATTNIKFLFQSLGVRFMDHYVVGIDGIYSIESGRMDRFFTSDERLN